MFVWDHMSLSHPGLRTNSRLWAAASPGACLCVSTVWPGGALTTGCPGATAPETGGGGSEYSLCPLLTLMGVSRHLWGILCGGPPISSQGPKSPPTRRVPPRGTPRVPAPLPKYWSFSFSISLSTEYSGLISFRMDWFDLLAVQGTLKSLLKHHSSKASILRCSAFFTVQLS